MVQEHGNMAISWLRSATPPLLIKFKENPATVLSRSWLCCIRKHKKGCKISWKKSLKYQEQQQAHHHDYPQYLGALHLLHSCCLRRKQVMQMLSYDYLVFKIYIIVILTPGAVECSQLVRGMRSPWPSSMRSRLRRQPVQLSSKILGRKEGFQRNVGKW